MEDITSPALFRSELAGCQLSRLRPSVAMHEHGLGGSHLSRLPPFGFLPDDLAARLDGRSMNGYEVARGIPWHTDVAATGFDGLSFLDQRLAVVETLAHLELMRSEGQLAKSVRNGIIVYRKA